MRRTWLWPDRLFADTPSSPPPESGPLEKFIGGKLRGGSMAGEGRSRFPIGNDFVWRLSVFLGGAEGDINDD